MNKILTFRMVFKKLKRQPKITQRNVPYNKKKKKVHPNIKVARTLFKLLKTMLQLQDPPLPISTSPPPVFLMELTGKLTFKAGTLVKFFFSKTCLALIL